MTAGIKIIASTAGGINRRERFILAIALGAGLGVTIIPAWTQNALWPVTEDMSNALKGFRDGIIITLSTGYRSVQACYFLVVFCVDFLRNLVCKLN